MKNPLLIFSGLILAGLTTTFNVYGQQEENNSNLSVNADLYSNYIWRGSRFGTGPQVQPSVKYTNGGLTIGVWGSFDFSGYSEADPYLSFSFPFGLSLGLTDYYYPGLALFDASEESGSHALELNAGYTYKILSLSGNYILNQAGRAGSTGGDIYLQAGLTFEKCSLFAGAGNGWHTTDGEFNFCNVGFGTSKTIEISGTFSVPVTGQVIINPDREMLFLVVGFSF